MCGPDAATTNLMCTNGLEIEFYSNLTTERALYPTRSRETFPVIDNSKKKYDFFLSMIVSFVVVVLFLVGMVVGVVMVVRMVPFLDMRLA